MSCYQQVSIYVDAAAKILNNAGMNTTSEKLMRIYHQLLDRFGAQNWWPGDTQDEIITGAVLTQNTNWKNVEKAIKNLKSASLMSLEKLHRLEHQQLAELIRPAGYYNIKAKRLKNLLDWFADDYNYCLEDIQRVDTATLRSELLGINGVGRETADSILLYAFQRPVFVVDTYTYRIATRHQLIEADCDYEQLRSLFEDNLEDDLKLFNEFHALIVCAGKDFCRPKARCSSCPLEELPHMLETEEY